MSPSGPGMTRQVKAEEVESLQASVKRLEGDLETKSAEVQAKAAAAKQPVRPTAPAPRRRAPAAQMAPRAR